MSDPNFVPACRHLCQEARTVLTSLRSGPPHVARGDLAQDFMDLRSLMERIVGGASVPPTDGGVAAVALDGGGGVDAANPNNSSPQNFNGDSTTTSLSTDNPEAMALAAGPEEQDAPLSSPQKNAPSLQSAAVDPSTNIATMHTNNQNPYARPFLQVIMDPRAAGPHTLVTLRAVQRLLEAGTFLLRPHSLFGVSAPELCVGILACKFEQTDAAIDEAVEMAIADVLQLIVSLTETATNRQDDIPQQQPQKQRLPSVMVMDAFNTVFVTRHTFVQSPAMAYHFEDVLNKMVATVFSNHNNNNTTQVLLLSFLVNQLLHTPWVGAEYGSSSLDESTREARLSHDDTRTLCLRLVRCALRHGQFSELGNASTTAAATADASVELSTANSTHTTEGSEMPRQQGSLYQTPLTELPETYGNDGEPDKDLTVGAQPRQTLLSIIQDDLCLSLLMTGQAIWAYNPHQSDKGSASSPGFVSLEVLSEICAVLAVLWNTASLRIHLIAQFETIWTGFYSRALVLLRRRNQPINSVSFHANILFDAEVEIILESLVDLLCLHNHGSSIPDGSLETMFSYYDCHMNRSDVAASLFVELSRCCGGTVNEEGQAVVPSASSSRRGSSDGSSVGGVIIEDADNQNSSFMRSNDMQGAQKLNHARPVPAHLKELCAQALTGGMKCLFRDDHASAETLFERSKRKHSIMLRHVQVDNYSDEEPSGHHLRDLKSRKRLMCKAARVFNEKASRGIELLVDSGLVPSPMTPESMASFLRNGIVIGLDKKAVGAYLGEAGKAPMAGKSPPCWERDYFHKEVLQIYCSLFRFEGQTLLDSLRMFLATFRLPGEAQQIDRILQAFSDCCSKVCNESHQGIFSSDPKRASDAAYLLSFSIIMLNTDRHNKNIREDRKMSCDDFYKNNFDYGRDITEKGKEFPREYLKTIYDSINDEEIRTEGEGSDGAMTVERWKDVLRGSTTEEVELIPSSHDTEDLTELVLEHVWKPIVSAIGALWDVTVSRSVFVEQSPHPAESSHGNFLGVQGARLGMDMANEMLKGICHLGRVDIFRKIFISICDFTGLLGEYTEDIIDRVWTFSNSLESQAALIVAIRTACDFGEEMDEECWKRIWSIMFELRDLKLIGPCQNRAVKSIFSESDDDLLNEMARMDWTMCLEKGDLDYSSRADQEVPKDKGSGLFGAFGRALFGQATTVRDRVVEKLEETLVERTVHGKETLVVWDEQALSDDEGNAGNDRLVDADEVSHEFMVVEQLQLGGGTTAGMQFEGLLVRENIDTRRQLDVPVTGLERIDDSRQRRVSQRARVRERLRLTCDFASLISQSRFMDVSAVKCLLRSLVSLVSSANKMTLISYDVAHSVPFERSESDASLSTASVAPIPSHVPISPGSEAFAEILICEVAVKNKDRMKELWMEVLQDHYLSRLTQILVNPGETLTNTKIPVDPGLEKRVTGLLRLSFCAVQRSDMANEVLSAWKYLLPVNDEQHASSPLRALDRHIGEGLWRVATEIDFLRSNLNEDGWEGLVSLMTWCAKRGGALKPISKHGPPCLAEDDPALQCYRTLHLLLNSKELHGKIPCTIVSSLRYLIAAGGRRNYGQLSMASLDLLDILHEKKLNETDRKSPSEAVSTDNFWPTCWRRIIEGFAEAAELSEDAVRDALVFCLLFIVSYSPDDCFTCSTGDCFYMFT